MGGRGGGGWWREGWEWTRRVGMDEEGGNGRGGRGRQKEEYIGEGIDEVGRQSSVSKSGDPACASTRRPCLRVLGMHSSASLGCTPPRSRLREACPPRSRGAFVPPPLSAYVAFLALSRERTTPRSSSSVRRLRPSRAYVAFTLRERTPTLSSRAYISPGRRQRTSPSLLESVRSPSVVESVRLVPRVA